MINTANRNVARPEARAVKISKGKGDVDTYFELYSKANITWKGEGVVFMSNLLL